ncbi:MAG: hypothetical protein WA705_13035 [Candidatus Ozemobacteraceae bacterium]
MIIRLVSQGVSAIVSLALGSFVLFQGPRKPINRVLSGIAFASFFYNLFQIIFNLYPNVWFVRTGYAGAILLIPLLTEFPDAVLENRYARPRTRRVVVGITIFFLACLPTELIFLDRLDRMGSAPLALGGSMMLVYAAVMGWALLRIAYRFIKTGWKCQNEMLRRRIEFILLGELFYVLCAVHDVLLRQQLFWIFDFPIVEWATLGFMFIVTYATLRYKLLDIDTFLGIGLYYSLMTLAVAAVYRQVENLFENTLQVVVPADSWVVKLLPAFFVALLFGLIRDLSSRLTDAFFLKPELRPLKIFRNPNFQYLVLDNRREELTTLRNELDGIIAALPESKNGVVASSGEKSPEFVPEEKKSTVTGTK